MKQQKKTDVNIFLFEGFETLDIFGPVEVLGRVEEYQMRYYSVDGGCVLSAQNTEIMTQPVDKCNEKGIFVIPGGRGTRPLVMDNENLKIIKKYAEASTFCLSICTGAAVLAKCGVLNKRKATSNKKAFDWVMENGKDVNWIRKARWCVDEKYYTASGVSAGIDMTLGFVADQFGIDRAEKITEDMEYIWNRNAENDIFAS